jgi:BirA family transcriptional regulator, biotin operon repressor / biotin---[acetyl-CoA-carboxylase] ligase
MKSFRYPGLIDEVIDLDVVDSTNRYALDAGRSGLLVRARTQTSGRGRRGRTWFSPEDQNIYMTITLSPPEERYPLIAGVAVRAALASLLGEADIEIKWPNDIITSGKKLCGILCEARGAITAVGLGVNVNQTSWPDDLKQRATSLQERSFIRFSLDEVVKTIIEHLGQWLERFYVHGFEPVREEFLRHGLLKGYDLLTEDNERCTVVDLEMDGRLIINVSGVLKTLHVETIHLMEK